MRLRRKRTVSRLLPLEGDVSARADLTPCRTCDSIAANSPPSTPLALHHLDGYRPDLKIIDVNLVRRFWYLDYLERHVPDYMDALRSEVDTYKVPPTPSCKGRLAI